MTMNNLFFSNPTPYPSIDLEAQRNQLAAIEAQHKALLARSATPLADEIDKELGALSEVEQNSLLENKEYVEAAEKVKSALGAFLISAIKPQFEASKEGKELLEAQLKALKVAKESVKKESDKRNNLINEYLTKHSDVPFAEWIKSQT